MQQKVEIYPEPDGSFAFDNGKLIRISPDKDAVGADLEPMLWPLISEALERRKSITITIQY